MKTEDEIKEKNAYQAHANREFKVLGWDVTKDKMQQIMCKGVFDLLEVFSKQNHSGCSAPYAISLFKKLASFESLSPLTGEDDEWRDIGNGQFQNKRCSHVFKDSIRAYDSNGKIFREPNGQCYTSCDSHVDVIFPYTPKTEYVDVEDRSKNKTK